MPEDLAGIYLQYGVLGGTVIGMAAVILVLYRDLRSCEKELRSCEKDRVNDVRPVVVAIEASARALAAMTVAMDNRSRASDAIAAALAQVTAELEHVQKTVDSLERRSS